MPRKPKVEKRTIQVIINGKPVAVTLHPPTARRRSWYAYWAGLVASRSTGQTKLEDAIIAAESMVKNGGKKAAVADAVLSDEEFEAIQRIHFQRKHAEQARRRAEKSLQSCLDAIAAFREIAGLFPVTLATPDDCARFQRTALTLPKLWRRFPPDQRKPVDYFSEEGRNKRWQSDLLDELDKCPHYSVNNVVKWSRTLQAAFERANRNALKRKCVRGVVDEKQLLTANPWSQFTWIEGKERPIRQFDSGELLAFLDHFEQEWAGFTVPLLLAKTYLWSWGRRIEVASLQWSELRNIGDEHHFDITGKWGVQKWFRVPGTLFQDLLTIRTESPYVFAAYSEQLRQFYERTGQPENARMVKAEFGPENVANWFYKRIKAWSKNLPKGTATPHIFRKTTLQYARRGEDINQQVAWDAQVSPSVATRHYIEETTDEMREKSNRTYKRILAALPFEVARRYGHVEVGQSAPEEQVQAAITARNWPLAAALTARLARGHPEVGAQKPENPRLETA